MRLTGKRVLSALLTIAMIATLLVVPAAAAGTPDYVWYDGRVAPEGTEGTFFTVTTGMNTGVSYTSKYGTHTKALKMDSKGKVTFTIPEGASGTLKLAARSTGADKESNCNFTVDSTVVKIPWDSGAGTSKVLEYKNTTLTPGQHTITRNETSGKKAFEIYYLCWIPGPSETERAITFKVPEGVTVNTVQVDGTDVNFTETDTGDEGAPLNAAKTAAVTFKLTAENLYSVDGVTLDGSDITPDGDGVYTVPASESAQTVSITASNTRVLAESVTIDPADDVVFKLGGEMTKAVSITRLPANSTDELEIVSSNENVAAWSEGTLTGKAIGQATISATAGEKNAQLNVSVLGADQTASPYTFNAANMAVGNLPNGTVKYDNYFTITANGSKVESNSQEIAGVALEKRLNPSSKGSIAFTTTVEKSKVEVWYVQNAARDFNLDGTTASSVLGSKPTENTGAKVTFENVAQGEHTIAMDGGTMYIYQIVVTEATGTETTDAPAFATEPDGSVAQVQKDGKVTFTLTAQPEANTVYKLYNAETEGTQMGSTADNAGVTASEGKITFTLTEAQMEGMAKDADTTWYVSATETDKAESTRTAVTLKPYIAVTSVTLRHMNEDGKTVKHELYEKMPDAETVTGSAENETVSYPNAWQLVAVVKPDNATNKDVTFSNLRNPAVYVDVTEEGLVTAKAGGGAGQIRVASVDDPEIKIDVDVTVKVYIDKVEIQKKDGAAAPATLAMGESLELGAAVTTSASGRDSHKEVTWSTSDESKATVSSAGVVTPAGVGTVTITATSVTDPAKKGELELTITKGTPELKLTAGNATVTSEGTVRFKLEGVPQDATPDFSVKQGETTVNTVTVEALENDENYNYKAEMPANTTGSTVTYTITASVAANDNWNAAEASADVGVLDATAKNIFIVSPGTTAEVEMTKGKTAELKVVAQVNGAGQVKDETATAALTYAWTKDGEAMSDTTYAVTVDAAGEYVCTVTSADEKVVTKSVSVTFTVVEVVPAMTTINVTAASGVDYTAATGALKITGPVAATFTVTTAPDGHEDTVKATSDKPAVAQVDLVDGKLTVTPKSVGTATITLKGEKATDVVKTITVTVAKAAAPAALTASDYTVTQPTTVGGKGTIKITQNAPAGTEYVYRLGDSGDWIKFPANKTIEVEPGIYKIRVYVPEPALQETTNGVAVEIKAVAAAPTVERVAVSATADSVKVGASVQMSAQVHMSNNTVSATEKVTWATSDDKVATVSATGLVTGVKKGVVTITATSVTDSAKKGSKTITVTEEQGPAAVDKAALSAAITEAEGVYAIDKDVKVMAAGTKASAVTKGQKFVTADKLEALEKAIAAAKAVLADEKATQAEVDKAVADLTAAKTACKVLTGTKSSGGSTSRPSSRPSRPTETVTKDDKGNTSVKTTDTQGNTAITVTAENGETIAKVDLPATIPSVGYKFVDVPDGHWAEPSINDLAGLGMVKGVNEAEHIYDMTSPVTRGSVATILFRVSNGKAGIAADFSDVTTDAWYADAVGWAAKYGVVTGFEDGTFAADASITREQLALMLYRYAKLLGMDVKTTANLDGFVDADKVNTWAAEAMTWAVGAGIIKGTDTKALKPVDAATRAETACMIDRFVELMR